MMKIKTIYLIGFLWIISSIGHAQDVVSKILLNNEFKWKDIELSNQENLKSSFLTQIKDFDRLIEDNSYTKKQLLNCLHVVDFNGDSFLDIIYEGFSGAEPNMVVAYLNSEHGFKEIFKDNQGISKIEITNGKISGVYVDDPGCCGFPAAYVKCYSVSYKSAMPKIELIIASRYFNDCKSVLPQKRFDKPIKFRINNDNYNLRYAPEINNKPGDCMDDIKGNIIGVINKDEIGYALGEVTDATGRIWWFSAFAPKTKHSYLYYDEYGEEDCWDLGWVSSGFVTEIE